MATNIHKCATCTAFLIINAPKLAEWDGYCAHCRFKQESKPVGVANNTND